MWFELDAIFLQVSVDKTRDLKRQIRQIFYMMYQLPEPIFANGIFSFSQTYTVVPSQLSQRKRKLTSATFFAGVNNNVRGLFSKRKKINAAQSWATYMKSITVLIIICFKATVVTKTIKNNFAEDGIDEANGLLRATEYRLFRGTENPRSKFQKQTLGISFWTGPNLMFRTPFRGTKIEANFWNSVPNHSVPPEEKRSRNLVPWNKNKSKLSDFCTEAFRRRKFQKRQLLKYGQIILLCYFGYFVKLGFVM